MDKVYLKAQLLKHKSVLKTLKAGHNLHKSINSMNDEELNLVLKILHLIGDGMIIIPEKYKQRVQSSKKIKKLTEIGSRLHFRNLMKQTRAIKLKTVHYFLTLLPVFIEALFH